MRKIKQIIVHCSDSDVKSHDNIATIRKWHKKRRFKDVGYHYFIRKNGAIERGRKIETIGAHCKGQNSDSIGVCFSGKHKFTDEQFKSFEKLLDVLQPRTGELLSIMPHSFYNKNKTCPNFDVNEMLCQPMNITAPIVHIDSTECDQ